MNTNLSQQWNEELNVRDTLHDLEHVIESEIEALEESMYGWLDSDRIGVDSVDVAS